MTTTSAPQPTLNFAITATELKKSIDDIMAQELEVNNKVAGLAPEKQTFETVILPMSRVDNAVAGEAHLATNLSYFSPEKDVRDASLEADKAYDAFGIEQGMRVDLYQAVLNVFNKTDLATLDPEDARLLTKTELDFRRSGLALEESKRNELKEIRKKLSELGIDFSKNLNEESSCEYPL
jgi:Zn-dependent oligopeptidase